MAIHKTDQKKRTAAVSGKLVVTGASLSQSTTKKTASSILSSSKKSKPVYVGSSTLTLTDLIAEQRKARKSQASKLLETIKNL